MVHGNALRFANDVPAGDIESRGQSHEYDIEGVLANQVGEIPAPHATWPDSDDTLVGEYLNDQGITFRQHHRPALVGVRAGKRLVYSTSVKIVLFSAMIPWHALSSHLARSAVSGHAQYMSDA